jgi:hypothetical protein
MVMLVFSGMCMVAILLADRAAAIEFSVGWRFLIPLYIAVLGAYVLAGILNYTTRRPFASTAFWCMAGLLVLAFLWTLVVKDQGGGMSVVDHGGHTHEASNAVEAVPVRWSLVPACMLISMAALMIQALALLCALRLAAFGMQRFFSDWTDFRLPPGRTGRGGAVGKAVVFDSSQLATFLDGRRPDRRRAGSLELCGADGNLRRGLDRRTVMYRLWMF